jgi:hypothetical protein
VCVCVCVCVCVIDFLLERRRAWPEDRRHHRAADEFAPDHAGCYSTREGRDLEGIFVCLCTGIAGSSARAALQHVSQRPCADGQRLRESVHEVPIVLQNVPCSQGGI